MGVERHLKAALFATWDMTWEYRFPIMSHLLHSLKKPIIKQIAIHSSSKWATLRAARSLRPLWQRAIHVSSEQLIPPPVSQRQTVKYVIQVHNAKRAGRHYDLRFMVNGRGISFAVPKHRLPEGKNTLAVLQPDHSEDYFKFNGTIPDGNMGAGSVEIFASGEMDLIESSAEKIHFEIPDGPAAGRYVLIHTNGPNWLWRDYLPISIQLDKPNIRLFGKRHDDYIEKAVEASNRGLILEEKIDGSCETVSWDKDGRVELFSHRIGKNSGTPIRHTHKLPGLVTDLQKAGLKNTILQGEVYHKRGPSFLAGILNSNPQRARLVQERTGDVRIKLFRIVTFKGDDIRRDNYAELRNILGSIAHLCGSRVSTPKALTIKDEGKARKFAEDVRTPGTTPRDGIVAKDPTGSEEISPWYKIKPVNDEDLEIAGFTEEQNGGTLGSIQVKTPDNRIISIGTGWNKAEGKWIWNHREQLNGDIVKAAFHDRMGSNWTGGRFTGFHPSKSEYGLRMYADALSPEPSMVYRLKSAVGWRH